MPKNKHQTSTHPNSVAKRIFLITVTAVLAFLAGFFAVKKLNSASSSSSSQTNATSATSPSKETSNTAISQEDDVTVKPQDDTQETINKTPTQYDIVASPESSLTGTITTARLSGDKLIIRVSIDQYLSSGICTLTLSDSASSISRTASIIPEVSTSTCEGFDLPVSELSSLVPPINININLSSGDLVGELTGSVQ